MCSSEHVGCGLFNDILNLDLPEIHVPGYQYLGPFTKLEERLTRGDPGINGLDHAAKEHDISYSKHKDIKSRHIADKKLEHAAWERVLASDSNIPEKAVAYLTTNAMKLKQKLGLGYVKRMKDKNQTSKKQQQLRQSKKLQKKKISFKELVENAKNVVKGNRSKHIINDRKALKRAASVALQAIGSRFGALNKKLIKQPRVIPIPKTGGILPLIPILAGISKIGAIASSASAVINTIKDIINLRNQMKNGSSNGGDSRQVGTGLFLAPYRKGYGLFLRPYPKN